MTNMLQLKIALDEITPPIWRRFIVKDSIRFQGLHEIIQTVMGWENYHMFEFQMDDVHIGNDEEVHNLAENSFKKLHQSPQFLKMLEQTKFKNGYADFDMNKVNKILKNTEKNKPKENYTLKSKMSELFIKEKQRAKYVYDFGDNWEHTIIVEKISGEKVAEENPVCLAGERACPPEDCGSVSGYYELVEIQKNKNHPEYEEKIVEWLGEDFDFEKFDVKGINKKLLKQSIKVDGRTRYWVPT